MTAADAVKKIIESCDLLLDGELFSKELLLQTFVEFLSANTEKKHHNVGFVLHTGSICFDAISLAYAMATCLVYNTSGAEDVISSLNVGDTVIYTDGTKSKKCLFQGFENKNGRDYIKLMSKQKNHSMASNDIHYYLPSEMWRKITPYFGESTRLDGRGLRKKNVRRDEFYTDVLGFRTEEIPNVLNVSAVLVMPKDRASELLEKLTIRFNEKEIKILEIITVSYFSENDEYQYRGNAAKTEPVIKITSKVSVARQLLLSRNGNRHIGLIVLGNEIISRSLSELPELLNRQSIQYVYILMNTDSENALPLIREVADPDVFACSKDFLLSYSLPPKCNNKYTTELECQVDTIIERDIKPRIFDGYFAWDDYKDFKKAVISIKNSNFVAEEKEQFVITAYSLLNLFLTSVFSITALEECILQGMIKIIPIEQRFRELNEFADTFPAGLRDKADIIIDVIKTIYLKLTETSAKESYLREVLKDNSDKKIAVIVPKKYYATVMKECGFYNLMDNEHLLTVTNANRFDNTIMYDRIIVTGNFYGKRFDVFRCMASKKIETLLYESELNLHMYRMKSAVKTEMALNALNKNFVPFDSDDITDDLHYTGDVDDKEIEAVIETDTEVDNYISYLDEISSFRNIESVSVSQGGTQYADIIAVGTFDSGEKALFTKLYKAYVFDEDDGTVKEVNVTDLSEGDSIVFTLNNSATHDIVDNILSRLIDEHKMSDKIIDSYNKSKYWKQVLQNYMNNNGVSAKAIASAMIKNGVTVQEMTIRGWLDEDSHTVGPRTLDSIQQIALLVEDDELFENAEMYFESCRIIRKIRRNILGQIGKAIISKLSGKEPIDGALTVDIYERIDSVAQVLRLDSIIFVNRSAPINMINRPINL